MKKFISLLLVFILSFSQGICSKTVSIMAMESDELEDVDAGFIDMGKNSVTGSSLSLSNRMIDSTTGGSLELFDMDAIHINEVILRLTGVPNIPSEFGVNYDDVNDIYYIDSDGTYSVQGNTAARRIVVGDGLTVTLILNGNEMSHNSEAPITIGSNADVTILMRNGKSTIISNSQFPAIYFKNPSAPDTTLYIGEDLQNSVSKSNSDELFAVSNGDGAAIGTKGEQKRNNSTIAIYGNVTAKAISGAGIGGGKGSDGGTIIINPYSNVIVSNDGTGAGIGGGENGDGGDITINEHSNIFVYSTQSSSTVAPGGAGIGGGARGSGGNISINGGNIYITNLNSFSAGIGGGTRGDGGNIKIDAENVSILSKNSVGAGIGGGIGGSSGNIIINKGNFKITNTGEGAAIGSGAEAKNNGTITINGGDIAINVTGSGAGIGGGKDSDGGIIKINGGTVDIKNRINQIYKVAKSDADDERKQGSGAGIGGGKNGNGGEITINKATVNIDIKGNNVRNSPKVKSGAALIGGGNGGNGGNININGAILDINYLNNSGAGIGGGFNGDAGNIKIDDGVITIHSEDNYSAGIGGGYEGASGNIIINKGNLKISNTSQGAAIGSGPAAKDKGTVTINGGNVVIDIGITAKGAGIGGGANSDGGNINIKGGNIKVNSNYFGAGIGGGANSDGGNIIIDGGVVTVFVNSNYGYGAGIGGGYNENYDPGGSGGNITINNGKIHVANAGNGAAIGGGSNKDNTHGGAGGNIVINGGEITAHSINSGAAIGGGGNNGLGANVTIENSNNNTFLVAQSDALPAIHALNEINNGSAGVVHVTLPLNGKSSTLLAIGEMYDNDRKAINLLNPQILSLAFTGNAGENYMLFINNMMDRIVKVSGDNRLKIEADRKLMYNGGALPVKIEENTKNKVTLDAQGGTFTGNQQKADFIVYHMDLMNYLDIPVVSKPGYSLKRWVDVNGNIWDFAANLIKKDITLYAEWEAIPYKVTLNAQGGTFLGNSQTYNLTVNAGGKINKSNIPRVNKPGYKLSKWLDDDGNEWDFDNNQINKDTMLYAQWEVLQYTVTFNALGGSFPGNINVYSLMVDYGDKVSKTNMPQVSKTGYRLIRWMDDIGNEWDFDKSVVNKHTALYADWQPLQYKVTFDVKGGSFVGSEQKADLIVNYGHKVSKTNIPQVSKTGYTLSKWVDIDGNEWDFDNNKIEKDTTLYAEWEALEYTLKYHIEVGSKEIIGSTSDTVPKLLTNTVYYGDLIHPPTPNPKPFSPEEYYFSGWSYNSEGTGFWNFLTDRVMGDTDLYAIWSNKQETIKFDTKGGYPIPQDYIGNIGDKITINIPEPTKDGFKFEGWYTDSEFTIKWNFLESRIPVGGLTLYANWIPILNNVNSPDKEIEMRDIDHSIGFDNVVPVNVLPLPSDKQIKYSYKVVYYINDTPDVGFKINKDFIVHTILGKEMFAEGINLTFEDVKKDLGENWLNLYRPVGYELGYVLERYPIITNNIDENVVNVVYAKTKSMDEGSYIRSSTSGGGGGGGGGGGYTAPSGSKSNLSRIEGNLNSDNQESSNGSSSRNEENLNKVEQGIEETKLQTKDISISDKHLPYIFGYPDGTFRPDTSLTRAEAAAIIYRLIPQEEKNNYDDNFFNDITPNSWYFEAINFLAYKGLIKGYPDNSFKADSLMTRAEFCAIVASYIGIESDIENSFIDIGEDYWAAKYISSMKSRGFLLGYPDMTFKPNNFITRAEVVAVINRVEHRKLNKIPEESEFMFKDVTSNHWAFKDIIIACSTTSD